MRPNAETGCFRSGRRFGCGPGPCAIPPCMRLGARLARWGQGLVARQGWIRKIPAYPASQWTKERDFPALAPQSFRERWKKL